jgi:hypothetical protein
LFLLLLHSHHLSQVKLCRRWFQFMLLVILELKVLRFVFLLLVVLNRSDLHKLEYVVVYFLLGKSVEHVNRYTFSVFLQNILGLHVEMINWITMSHIKFYQVIQWIYSLIVILITMNLFKFFPKIECYFSLNLFLNTIWNSSQINHEAFLG